MSNRKLDVEYHIVSATNLALQHIRNIAQRILNNTINRACYFELGMGVAVFYDKDKTPINEYNERGYLGYMAPLYDFLSEYDNQLFLTGFNISLISRHVKED